jgi:membrane protease YdiL (CAAX protease family)
MRKNIAPKWYIGLIIFVVTIFYLIFIAAPLQFGMGMGGVALTEIGFVIISLITVVILGWKWRDVLPFKRVTLLHIGATVLLLAATDIVVIAVTAISSYFFPNIVETGNALGNFFTTVPYGVAILIVAVMPALCEEILFRGVIQHTLKDQKEWVMMVVMGLLFGIFHLDPHRFLPTAIIGFVLTYLMIRTQNFFMPVLYHFINNAFSVSMGYGTYSGGMEVDTSSMVIGVDAIGAYLVLAALAPILYFFAGKLLSSGNWNKKYKYIAIALSVLLVVLGFIVIAVAVSSGAVTTL